jgi:hypothetical protein
MIGTELTLPSQSAKKERIMSDHRYACGQHVTFASNRTLLPGWTGAFVIRTLLPSGGGEPRYEIKSTGETYSRVAYEKELSARPEGLPG